jgi:hypothetical protein
MKIFVSIVQTIKAHWFALVLSVLVGVVVIAPQIIFVHSLGSAYQGIYMLKTDAELHYLARMEEAKKGEGIGNPFIVEYRSNVPSGFYSYSETVLALPAMISSISIPTLNLWYKFLLPIVLTLLLYGFVFRLSDSRGWSLVAGVAVVLGSTNFNAGSVLNLLHLNFSAYDYFLLYSRPVNPIFSLIVLFLYLHTVLSATRVRKLVWFLVAGILAGLAWYIYIYLATFILALEVGCVIIYACWKNRTAAFHHGALVLTSLVVGSWGIWSIYSITKSPYYALFSLFSGPEGIIHGHIPQVHIPWLIITLLFLLFWYYHRTYRNALFISGLLFACLAVINQQVITGVALVPGHYVTYFCIPVYIVVLCTVAADYFKDKPILLTRLVQVCVVLYVLAIGLFIQYSSYLYWAPQVAAQQRYGTALQWLSRNTPTDSVVMADESLSELIPVYTRDSVMWEAHADTYLMPQARLDFRPTQALASKNFCAYIKQYRLDYIVEDPGIDHWSINQFVCARLLTNVNGLTIYSVN